MSIRQERDPRMDPRPGDRVVPGGRVHGRWVHARDGDEVGWNRYRILGRRRTVRWCSLRAWRRWARDKVPG